MHSIKLSYFCHNFPACKWQLYGATLCSGRLLFFGLSGSAEFLVLISHGEVSSVHVALHECYLDFCPILTKTEIGLLFCKNLQ